MLVPRLVSEKKVLVAVYDDFIYELLVRRDGPISNRIFIDNPELTIQQANFFDDAIHVPWKMHELSRQAISDMGNTVLHAIHDGANMPRQGAETAGGEDEPAVPEEIPPVALIRKTAEDLIH